jgi:LysR family transcriptional regulator, low CO2-responsive transcriptional regulator
VKTPPTIVRDDEEAQRQRSEFIAEAFQPKSKSGVRKLYNSRHLEIFRLLAWNKNFTQTALTAQISQSAVSNIIQSLEKETGCRLVERNSRNVTLTPSGDQFLHHVERILEEMASAGFVLERLRTWGQVRLRAAAPASLCEKVMPQCLQQVRRQYPNCSITLLSADRDDALEHLLDGRIELTLTTGSEPDERFECHPLFYDELGFVMPPDHAWASALPVLPGDITAEPMIAAPRDSHTLNLVLHHLRPDQIEPNILIESDSIPAIRDMILRGMGVGILPKWCIAPELARGELVFQTLGKRPLRRKWSAISLRAKRLSLPQTMLVAEVRRLCLETLPGVLSTDHPVNNNGG